MAGYAGIQTMLLAYKMRKSDQEFKLTQITTELTSAGRNSSALSEWRQEQVGELDKDDPDYDTQVDDIDAQYNEKLADIASWEDELDQQKSNCETEIKMLDGYIDTWSQALQSNIQKSHTYGPSQG